MRYSLCVLCGHRHSANSICACLNCGKPHSGGYWQCESCCICNCWHESEHCLDVHINKCCKACGQNHASHLLCPCSRCHAFHPSEDCAYALTGLNQDAFVPSRSLPCKSCGVWHIDSDFGSCQSKEHRLTLTAQPCSHCHVWHGPETCATYPSTLQAAPVRVPSTMFVNRAMQQNEQFGLRDAASQQQDLGLMSDICRFCRARFWKGERINCCFEGSLNIEEIDVPPQLQNVILKAAVRADIRQYNMAMAMASVGHSNKSLRDGTFVMGGKSYHRIGNLMPRPGNEHQFAQIYILDTEEATARRQTIFGNRLNRDILAQLHNLMLQYNPHVRQFRQAVESSTAELVWSSEDDISGMQIGAIVQAPGQSRAIIIRRMSDHGSGLSFISDSHKLYHTLTYPLLFPTGSSGWHNQMLRYDSAMEPKRVSLTDYMRYKLMHRDEPTHLQRCERLTLEFYCDAWAQVEARVASFHRLPSQQSRYRVGRKCAIDDQLSVEGGNVADVSIPMILPSSFVGSSKWYHMVSPHK